MRHPLHQSNHDIRRTSIRAVNHSSGLLRLRRLQRGTALVMSLIFLLILTILGVTAMTTSSLQEKMAGNLRDQFMAMESAESALRAGEQWLYDFRTQFGAASGPPGDTCPGSNDPAYPTVWTNNCAGSIDAQPDSWWASSAVAYDSQGLGASWPIYEVAAQPRYIIEFLQEVPDDPSKPPTIGSTSYFYKISGWSYGATQSARSLLQNTFRRRFD